jgi:hypothetical protein
MKKLLPLAVAALVLGACASMDDTSTGGGTSPGSKAARDDYVTGSRIPRSENNENYQGSKTMTGKDYRDYKASQGANSN